LGPYPRFPQRTTCPLDFNAAKDPSVNRNTHEDMEFVLNSLESGVIDIQSTDGSFAALKSNGQVVRWGNLG
jgi:hypothetical protein